jgi:peptidoglycan/LPS O-acetylase OafA/YrhL
MQDRSGSPRLLIGKPFDSRNNGLNLIRFLLALAVLIHHSWPLSGRPEEPSFAGDTLGGWAVAGFFVVSGYLITASRYSNSLGEYLVHRVARIMPAFVVCLLVVAAIFAPIGWYVTHGTFEGFLTTGTTPFNYIFSNLGLRMQTYDIGGTPVGVPYPGAWNGSLWSLYYEFCCYLIVAFIGLFAVFRTSPWPVTVLFIASVAVNAQTANIAPYTQGNFDLDLLFRLLPFFLGGAVLQAWRHRVGIHWALGTLSIAVSIFVTAAVPGWGGAASAVFIAYGTFWIASWMPSPVFVRKNDVSYGLYIYAFPVQQALAMAGVHEHGLFLFMVAATLGTLPLAIASWLVVERPIMRRVRRNGKTASPDSSAVTVPGNEGMVSGTPTSSG